MARSKRPNFLWISFEDTNPFYGCYGDQTARTPNLDRLAAAGAIFTHCYSTAGVCAPARSAVITGMYPTSIGTHHMRTAHVDAAAPDLPTPYSAVIPHYVKCFTEYLRADGYYCTNNVKTDYQFTPPRTAWDELSETAHWRNRPDPDQPFFAVFNPTRTHESSMWEEKTPEVAIDPATVRVPPYFVDTPKTRAALAKMHGNIARSDRELGELLAQLEEDGLADNTVVMHWSDHGPLPRGKRWPYDSGIRVPLIIRWPAGAGNPSAAGSPGTGASNAPGSQAVATVNAAGGHLPGDGNDSDRAPLPPMTGGFAPGTVHDRLVSTIDLGPTLLSLAGIPTPAHMQGRPFLGPAAEPEREYVFATRDRYDTSYDMIRAVRDRRYKLLRHYYPNQEALVWVPYRNRLPIMQDLYDGYRCDTLDDDQHALFRPRAIEELYDTAADPYELTNLAQDPQYREVLERLRGAIESWRDDVGDLGTIDESQMVRSWYPDGKQPTTAAPIIVPFADGWYGQTPAEEIEVTGPCVLQLQCSTQGASIAYRFDSDRADSWRLYTAPLRVTAPVTVRARAIRVGYHESTTTALTVRSVDSRG